MYFICGETPVLAFAPQLPSIQVSLPLHNVVIYLLPGPIVLDKASIHKASALKPKLNLLPAIPSLNNKRVHFAVWEPSVEERPLRADHLVNVVIFEMNRETEKQSHVVYPITITPLSPRWTPVAYHSHAARHIIGMLREMYRTK
jgi:hypothetical protein